MTKDIKSGMPTITRRSAVKGMAVAGAGAVAAPGLIGSAAAKTGRKIKIGFISPETGPVAAFGSADQWVVDGVMKAIGGAVEINGVKHPVEILIRDSQSNPSRAAEVASQLITADKVDLLLASSTGDTTAPPADQAEVNGTPFISADTPWEAWFFGRGGDPKKGFDWTYHFFWGLQQISDTFVGLWNQIPTNKKVGCLWGNDTDGVALGNEERGMPPVFKKAGYEVINTGLFTTLSNDFTAQINKLKAENCEIVTGMFIPPDWATFWAQCAQQGYKPKVATIAKALLFPASVESLGDRGVGLTSEVWWSPNHPFKSGLTGQSAGEFCAQYTKDTGKQWVQPLGFKHAILEVAIDVLKRTKNVDKAESIRDAIAETDYKSLVGPISWKNGPVKNCAQTPLVGGQWIKGDKFKYEIVNVDNTVAPEVPTVAKMIEVPYS